MRPLTWFEFDTPDLWRRLMIQSYLITTKLVDINKPSNVYPKRDPKSHYECHLSHIISPKTIELWSWGVHFVKKKKTSQRESKACHTFPSRSPIQAPTQLAAAWLSQSKGTSVRNPPTNTRPGACVTYRVSRNWCPLTYEAIQVYYQNEENHVTCQCNLP